MGATAWWRPGGYLPAAGSRIPAPVPQTAACPLRHRVHGEGIFRDRRVGTAPRTGSALPYNAGRRGPGEPRRRRSTRADESFRRQLKHRRAFLFRSWDESPGQVNPPSTDPSKLKSARPTPKSRPERSGRVFPSGTPSRTRDPSLIAGASFPRHSGCPRPGAGPPAGAPLRSGFECWPRWSDSPWKQRVYQNPVGRNPAVEQLVHDQIGIPNGRVDHLRPPGKPAPHGSGTSRSQLDSPPGVSPT